MIKIGFTSEVDKLEHLPQEVIDAVAGIAKELAHYYGECRNIDADLGGYILIITKEEDLYELKNINIDIRQSYPEFVDRIIVKGDNKEVEDWTNTLTLLNSDYSISIIMPMSITPQKLIDKLQ